MSNMALDDDIHEGPDISGGAPPAGGSAGGVPPTTGFLDDAAKKAIAAMRDAYDDAMHELRTNLDEVKRLDKVVARLEEQAKNGSGDPALAAKLAAAEAERDALKVQVMDLTAKVGGATSALSGQMVSTLLSEMDGWAGGLAKKAKDSRDYRESKY